MDQLDVVGEDSGSATHFVGHVGLAKDPVASVSHGDQIKVRHMKPPYEKSGAMRVHVVGSADLTVEDVNQIDLYLGEIESEYEAASRQAADWQQYVIRPHAKPWLAKDGTPLGTRFSCAGLVIKSYAEAGIHFINVSEDSLDEIDAETIDQAYFSDNSESNPQSVRDLSPRVREWLGIPGDGKWPVVLAGYVLHALDRTPEEIRDTPYQPTDNDAFFPRRHSSDEPSP